MSSEFWREPSKVWRIRSSQICRTPRRIVFVLGGLLCLAAFLPMFGAPAKAAIGAAAIGLRAQASQIAPVEQVQSTNGRRKYRWYANGRNGPGYYEVGEPNSSNNQSNNTPTNTQTNTQTNTKISNNSYGIHEYAEKVPNSNLTVKPLIINNQFRTIPITPLHLR
jgi:hypothetical protein